MNILYFSDLTQEKQSEIIEELEKQVRAELIEEATPQCKEGETVEQCIERLYDFKSDLEFDEFLYEKAQDRINRQFYGKFDY